ncbi:hypothetical protein GGS26DRAFT_570043 [Hypomontagnella submonticulosa]|nr:hypothetical protein GGS26DRAFT_570043 [Hypomontagnella submonticulosa]
MDRTSNIRIWLPQNFIEGSAGIVYMMNAAHRGDMYHMRASMALYPPADEAADKDVDKATYKPFGVVLHSYKKGPTDQLVDYITQLALAQGRKVFTTEWDYEILRGIKLNVFADNEGCVPGCKLDGQRIKATEFNQSKINVESVSESGCTRFIKRRVDQDPRRLNDLPGKMAQLTPEQATSLEGRFRELSPFRLLHKKTENTQNVLLLHRDSGMKFRGAYPELDSGAALWDLATMMEQISGEYMPKDVGKKLNVIFCGASAEQLNDRANSIGQYWTDLEPIKINGVSTRDIEAHFFRWAYREGYFQMVVGFRSGSLDLFTFLGIPTVSITLRDLIGNERHDRLRGRDFKRVNVEYDVPRHHATAWVKSKYSEEGKPSNVIASPYWPHEKPADAEVKWREPRGDVELPEHIDTAIRETGASRFRKFDFAIVRLGIMLACERYLGWEYLVRSDEEELYDHTVFNSTARFCWPRVLGRRRDEEVHKFFVELQKDDDEHLDYLSLSEWLQQPRFKLEQLEDRSRRDWIAFWKRWNSVDLPYKRSRV